MSVSAIIVTRGDHDLGPIFDSLPDDWEKILWDNSGAAGPLVRSVRIGEWHLGVMAKVADLSVYGRYAAIQYASHDLIYVQDDDCIVSSPQAIVGAWRNAQIVALDRLLYVEHIQEIASGSHLVANMPQEFRPHYLDSCLVGFGACFHRDLPARAFTRFFETALGPRLTGVVGPKSLQDDLDAEAAMLHRTCDVVFTTLTPRVLVDVPVEVLPYAHDSNRMWKQPDHFGERTRVLEMARKVRDA